MKYILAVVYLLLIIPMAASGQIAKEQHALCTGAGVCPQVSTVVRWGLDTRAEFALDKDTGCPGAATYTVGGINAAGTIVHTITILSNATVTSDALEPAVWFPTWVVVPSDTTGCTDLRVNIWVERPRPPGR